MVLLIASHDSRANLLLGASRTTAPARDIAIRLGDGLRQPSPYRAAAVESQSVPARTARRTRGRQGSAFAMPGGRDSAWLLYVSADRISPYRPSPAGRVPRVHAGPCSALNGVLFGCLAPAWQQSRAPAIYATLQSDAPGARPAGAAGCAARLGWCHRWRCPLCSCIGAGLVRSHLLPQYAGLRLRPVLTRACTSCRSAVLRPDSFQAKTDTTRFARSSC